MTDPSTAINVTADMTRQATAEVGALLNAGHPLHLIAIEMASQVLLLNAEIKALRGGAMTDLPDSGLRWCVEHASPHRLAPHKIGRIPDGAPMCAASIAQAWRASEPAFRGDEWPTECRHVPLLISDAPVAVDGQGVLLV